MDAGESVPRRTDAASPPRGGKTSPPFGFARRRSSTISRRRDSTTSKGSGDHKADTGPSQRNASSAWFDVPLVLALVPAAGSLVTGGEHIRDFLLLLMMLYYLHQLIKVPWDLYSLSRPHRQQARTPAGDDNDGPAFRAQNELHTLALFYLALTVASPLLGAYLLRTISAALFGEEYISWFSTLVFVLAAGIRPWRHLVVLLRARTLELQDIAHAGQPAIGHTPFQDGRSILQRLDALEQQLADALEDNDSLAAETEQLKLALDRAEEASEKAVRRAVRRADAEQSAHLKRIDALETRVDALAARPAAALGVPSSVVPSFVSRLLSGTSPRAAPATKRASTKPPRPKKLSRIPEDDELKLTDVDEPSDSDDEPEWYEHLMEVLFAPVRSLRTLFFSIVSLVRGNFFSDGHPSAEYEMNPTSRPPAFE